MESEEGGGGGGGAAKTITITKTLTYYNADGLQYLERDCGDYLEFTPWGSLIDDSSFKVMQGGKSLGDSRMKVSVPVTGAGGDQRPREPSYNHFILPRVSLKIPKNLPEDEAEREKILVLEASKALTKMVDYIMASIRKSNQMASERDQVEVVEEESDEVKKKKKKLRIN